MFTLCMHVDDGFNEAGKCSRILGITILYKIYIGVFDN